MRLSSSVVASGLIGGVLGALLVALDGVRDLAIHAARRVGPSTRAAVEWLMQEQTPESTGKDARFELAVEETKWELLPGVSTVSVTFIEAGLCRRRCS